MKRFLMTTIVLTLGVPGAAHAFCGFYVSGAGADMFNNATQVVLMRDGTRTVLSMQNNYQGPPTDFAMVVPVPVVLQEENVKTLDRGIFKRVDELAAPRLVEYWEQDPCAPMIEYRRESLKMASGGARRSRNGSSAKDLGVTIEAQFTVGEYQIVILSAKDSTGLDTWLRQENYKIPEGAEPLLKPYVEGGSKFFVAKVDVEKVKFNNGMAELSPLRFHYDSDEFSLPVRLGMINSAGTQDLIIHILAKGKRYQVANYENVTIPTNLDVKNEVRERFGEFYAALFDATLEKNPGAVVTEYSWDASSCDPCPTPALNANELATLGLDVLDIAAGERARSAAARSRRPPMGWAAARGFVLTRLHARYGKNSLANDLVFKEAESIAGGREFVQAGGTLEQGAQPSPINNFQARYAIRHEWTGPIECENPRRGVWGGRPAGVGQVAGSSAPKPATDLAFAPRGKASLQSFVAQDIPELQVAAAGIEPPGQAGQAQPEQETATKEPARPGQKDQPAPKKDSKGCDAGGGGAPGAGLLVLLLIVVATSRSLRTRTRTRQVR